MAQAHTDGSTAGLSGTFDRGVRRELASSPSAVPALTILFHPDVRRVGEWTVLSEALLGRETLVSRLFPEFSAPGRSAGEPLADRYLSRQPLRFGPAAGGGVVLSIGDSRTRVEADGAPVLGAREFPA